VVSPRCEGWKMKITIFFLMTVFTFGSSFDTGWVKLRSDVPRNVKFENSIEKVRFQNNIKENAKEFPLIAVLRPTEVRIFECSGREDNKCLAYKAKVIKVLKGKYNKPYITFVNDGWEASGISFSNKVYFLSKEYKDEDINEKVHYSPEFFEYEARQDIIDCFKK